MQVENFEVPEQFDEERIDKVLAVLYPECSRSFFQKLIKEHHVKVNEDEITKNSFKVAYQDLLSVEIPDAVETQILPEDIPLDILYEDQDVIVVNKPKDMVVHPAPGHYTGTLVNAILFYCKKDLSGINGEIRPGIVHRIDKDTTGSLIICKNDSAHNFIAEQIKVHSVNRIYRGIVNGIVKEESGTIEKPIGRNPKDRKKMAVVPNGKEAITHYKVLKRFKNTTYMEFKLETGRTHQIRVHMASIGHPLYGDVLYGGEKNNHHLQGQCLHAMTIGFLKPEDHSYVEVVAPLPAYFENLLEKFEGITPA